MAIVSKVINSTYVDNSSSANTSYKIFTLERSIKAPTIDSTLSSNFIILDVSYTDLTINGTLKARLLVSFVPLSGSLNIVPEGPVNEYEFPLTTGGPDLYELLQYPDVSNYYNYFMISFGISIDGLVDIYVNTPNYNGELMATVKHIIFE